MRYEVNKDTFEVQIFNEEDTVPFCIQPHYPNQDTFNSVAEASTWAELAIAALEDESAPYAPIGKGLAGQAKPTPEEIAEYELRNSRIPRGNN